MAPGPFWQRVKRTRRSGSRPPPPSRWQATGNASTSPRRVADPFRHAVIEYGGSTCLNGGQSSLFAAGRTTLTDSRIANSASRGVELTDQTADTLEFENNTFVDNAAASIFVTSNLLTSLGGGLSFLTVDTDGSELRNDDDRVEVIPSQQGIRNGDWLDAGVPFLIPEGVQVGQNQAVTIQAGTILHMGVGSFDASLGYLATLGTEDDPVVFTSAAGTGEAGAWPCVVLADAALEHTVIEYAGAGVGCVDGVDQQTGLYVTGTPTLSNVSVREVDGTAMYLPDCGTLDPAWCDGQVSYENVAAPAIECGDAEDACGG
jgi:hypothetical protein